MDRVVFADLHLNGNLFTDYEIIPMDTGFWVLFPYHEQLLEQICEKFTPFLEFKGERYNLKEISHNKEKCMLVVEYC